MIRFASALAVAILSALAITGCGGAGITLSATPQFSAELAVLGFPTPPLRIGNPTPDVKAFGYENGYVLAGAQARRWVWGKAAMG